MGVRPSPFHASRLSRRNLLITLLACSVCITSTLQAQSAHFSGAIQIHGRAPLDLSRNVLIPDTAAAPNAIQTTHGGFGSVNVGASSANPVAMVFTFDAAVTLGSTAVLTQGAKGLDFIWAAGGTCKSNTAYSAGDTCTVNVSFKPRFPGSRYGAAQLVDPSGNLLATGYVQGNGVTGGLHPVLRH